MPASGDRLPAFKAYDIRGRIPDELNRDLVYRIARGYAAFVRPQRVAVGYDIRLSSPEFALAVADGLTDSGVDVVDIGCCGTEEVYFATFHLGLDGGIMVTASPTQVYPGIVLIRRVMIDIYIRLDGFIQNSTHSLAIRTINNGNQIKIPGGFLGDLSASRQVA